ncbi:MAG: 50S ribosomal protein L18 [Holosporales bacterium]|jgi:large subunit ribosomal protein L18|nr:50S ribosomal protein L18 [Holosporales bacterium]
MMSSLELRLRRKARQRTKIREIGSGRRLRLCVHRTNRNIYAQVVDDSCGKTLLSVSTLCKDCAAAKNGGNKVGAALVGALLAKRAVEKNITKIVFDRSGFLYHGRVKALADSARDNGLVF